jgi:hypothetical protein
MRRATSCKEALITKVRAIFMVARAAQPTPKGRSEEASDEQTK